eukprot:Opistho-2@41878
MLAIMGSSGAGKSTLLDVLAGNVVSDLLTGSILVNGAPVDKSFRRIAGYVMQDDALFPMLTVRETLMYSARLRLPSSMSRADKAQRVEELIEELKLGKCANNIIGNERVRGVSGGERRRVSIGVDMIHHPAIIFLDEPTSGLDSTNALNVVSTIKEMAVARNRCCILTIHQPSHRVQEQFDQLMILSDGETVFYGPVKNLFNHFSKYGYPVPSNVDPVEYVLDVIEEHRADGAVKKLAMFYKERLNSAVSKQIVGGASRTDLDDGPALEAHFASNVFDETRTLVSRSMKNVLRTKELFFARLGMFTMVSVCLGLLFLDVGSGYKGIGEYQSYLAFVSALLIFTSTEALPLFLIERNIFVRENSRGAYRVLSYVFANIITYMPFFVILAFAFTIPSYWMVGLQADAGRFFFFVFAVWAILFVANAFVMTISTVVPDFITGNSISTALFAFMFLMSGFFIAKNSIPNYWIWFHYISIFKYAFEALMVNTFGDGATLEFYCDPVSISGSLPSNGTCTITGQQVLSDMGLSDVNKWGDVGAMVAFATLYRILFYLALKYLHKGQRK